MEPWAREGPCQRHSPWNPTELGKDWQHNKESQRDSLTSSDKVSWICHYGKREKSSWDPVGATIHPRKIFDLGSDIIEPGGLVVDSESICSENMPLHAVTLPRW